MYIYTYVYTLLTYIQMERLTRELMDVKGKLSNLESHKRSLETEKDDLEQKVRVLEASNESLR